MIQAGSPPTTGQLSKKGSSSVRATSGPQSKKATKVEEVNNTDRMSKLSMSSDPAENPNAFSAGDMRGMFDNGTTTTSRDARKAIRNANRIERSKKHNRSVDPTMSGEWETPAAWPPPGDDFVDLPHRKTIFDVPERPKYSAAPQGRWVVGRDDHWKFGCAPDRYNLDDDGGTAVAPRRSGKTLDWEQMKANEGFMQRKKEAAEKPPPKRRVSWGDVGTQTAESVVPEEPQVPAVVPRHLAVSTNDEVRPACTDAVLNRGGGWTSTYVPPSRPAVDMEKWKARNMGFDEAVEQTDDATDKDTPAAVPRHLTESKETTLKGAGRIEAEDEENEAAAAAPFDPKMKDHAPPLGVSASSQYNREKGWVSRSSQMKRVNPHGLDSTFRPEVDTIKTLNRGKGWVTGEAKTLLDPKAPVEKVHNTDECVDGPDDYVDPAVLKKNLKKSTGKKPYATGGRHHDNKFGARAPNRAYTANKVRMGVCLLLHTTKLTF